MDQATLDQVNQLSDQFNELYDQGDQLITLAVQLDELFCALFYVICALLLCQILWQILSPSLSLTWPLILTLIGELLFNLALFSDLWIEDQAKQLYAQGDQIRDLANHLRSLPGLDGDRTQ